MQMRTNGFSSVSSPSLSLSSRSSETIRATKTTLTLCTKRRMILSVSASSGGGGKKGEYYVGQGKWIKDQDGLEEKNKGLVSETGRDAVVGGFAGGEKRLQDYRSQLNAANAQEKAKEKKKPRKETKEVVLGKDFNSSVGGIFFGEVGLQSWKETGRIPTRSKEATLGWGPPVLLLLVAAAGVTYKTTGALSVDALTKTVESVGSGVTNIDVNDVVGKVGGAVGALDEGASVLPPEVRSVATQAALVGFGVLALYALIGNVVKTAKKTGGDFAKIALLVTVTWTIAKQILH